MLWWLALCLLVFFAFVVIAIIRGDPEGMNNPPLPNVDDPGPTELDTWKS